MPRKKLNKDETLSLQESYHELFVDVGKFRIDNKKKQNLSKKKDKDLEELQWSFLNIASELNAASVLMKTALLDDELKTLTQATKSMKSAAGKINNVKKWIRVGGKAIAFGAAIMTGQVPATVEAGKDLIDEMKNA